MNLTSLNSILIGIALGFQVVGIIFCVMLASKKVLMSSPYLWIGIGLLATAVTRADNFFHFMTLTERYILILSNSLFILIGLMQFWLNVKRKDG